VNRTRILGIETSCDETAAAVVVGGHEVLSSVVSSQIDLHARYGGVVPEIASRAHVELLTPVIARALIEAGIDDDHVDAVAATVGPGLIGALLIGVSAAKTLALTGVDLFTQPELLKKAKAEFVQRRDPDFNYEAMVGTRKPPLDYRD
jgi:tRNA A37 threonylcarbamoyltransferase TsaD